MTFISLVLSVIDQESVKTTLQQQHTTTKLGAFLIIFPEMWWIENKVICKPEILWVSYGSFLV